MLIYKVKKGENWKSVRSLEQAKKDLSIEFALFFAIALDLKINGKKLMTKKQSTSVSFICKTIHAIDY
jgi:hypothetical protein